MSTSSSKFKIDWLKLVVLSSIVAWLFVCWGGLILVFDNYDWQYLYYEIYAVSAVATGIIVAVVLVDRHSVDLQRLVDECLSDEGDDSEPEILLAGYASSNPPHEPHRGNF